MTLSMPKKTGQKKREERDLPGNVRRGLLAHAQGHNWTESAKISGLTPHALRQWRKHPQADSFISEAIKSHLEEAHGTLSKATPLLAEKLISIALDPKVRGYTSVQAISECFKIIQSGIVDRENKIEMRKLREAMERLSGNRIQDDYIDV